MIEEPNLQAVEAALNSSVARSGRVQTPADIERAVTTGAFADPKAEFELAQLLGRC